MKWPTARLLHGYGRLPRPLRLRPLSRAFAWLCSTIGELVQVILYPPGARLHAESAAPHRSRRRRVDSGDRGVQHSPGLPLSAPSWISSRRSTKLWDDSGVDLNCLI